MKMRYRAKEEFGPGKADWILFIFTEPIWSKQRCGVKGTRQIEILW